MKSPINDKEGLRTALVKDGGLDPSMISVPYSQANVCPLHRNCSPATYYCIYDGERFAAYLVPDGRALELYAKDHVDILTEAFAKVVGYRPFARYVHPQSAPGTTTEWNNMDPDRRFAELQTEGVTDLVRLPVA